MKRELECTRGVARLQVAMTSRIFLPFVYFPTFLKIDKFSFFVQFRRRSAILLHLLADIRRHSIDGDNFHPRSPLNANEFQSFALIAQFSRKLLQLSSSAVEFQCHGGAPRSVDSSHGTEVHRGRQANENLQQSLQDRAGERLSTVRKCQSNFIFSVFDS